MRPTSTGIPCHATSNRCHRHWSYHTRGLGAALAEALLAHDIKVLAVSRKRNAALSARFPDTLHEVELDLADLADLAAVEQWLAGDTMRRFVAGAERVLLVNNAGVLALVGKSRRSGCRRRRVRGERQRRGAADDVCRARFAMRRFGGQAHRSYFERRVAQCLSGLERLLRDQGRARSACASVALGVIDTDMQAEIRGTALERFPMRERFETLKCEGQLARVSARRDSSSARTLRLRGSHWTRTAPIVSICARACFA